MYMHSGDIMVMSGYSRLLYHAVPCIVPAPEGDPLHPSLEKEGLGRGIDQGEATLGQPVSEEDWAVCSRYIQTSRVNMTVRQVLASGQTFPKMDTPKRTDSGPTVGYNEIQDGVNEGLKRRRSDSDDTVES